MRILTTLAALFLASGLAIGVLIFYASQPIVTGENLAKPPPKIYAARLYATFDQNCRPLYLLYTGDVGLYIYGVNKSAVGVKASMALTHRGVIFGEFYAARAPPPYYTWNGSLIIATSTDVEDVCLSR